MDVIILLSRSRVNQTGFLKKCCGREKGKALSLRHTLKERETRFEILATEKKSLPKKRLSPKDLTGKSY
jgi:hypothetical protein